MEYGFSFLAGILTFYLFHQMGYTSLFKLLWQLNGNTFSIIQSDLVDDEKQEAILSNAKKLFKASFHLLFATLLVFLPSVFLYLGYASEFSESNFILGMSGINLLGIGLGIIIWRRKNEK